MESRPKAHLDLGIETSQNSFLPPLHAFLWYSMALYGLLASFKMDVPIGACQKDRPSRSQSFRFYVRYTMAMPVRAIAVTRLKCISRINKSNQAHCSIHGTARRTEPRSFCSFIRELPSDCPHSIHAFGQC